jgi:hypothetical protein
MSGARSGTRSEFPARRNVIALRIISESQSIGLRTGGRECLLSGPLPPKCGAAQVGRYLGYIGRGANAFGTAAGDPSGLS